MRRSSCIAAVLLAAVATACSAEVPGSASPPGWRRLRLTRVAPGRPGTAEVVRRISVPADGRGWRVRGEDVEFRTADDGTGRIGIGGRSGSLALPDGTDPASFNEVVVVGSFPRGAWLGLTLSGPGGRFEAECDVAAGDEPRAVRFHAASDALSASLGEQLTRVRLVASHPDGLECELRAIELWRRPSSAFLPSVETGPDWVDVGGDARRGVALARGEVLGAEFDAAHGEVVELHVTQLDDGPADDSTLEVEVTRSDGERGDVTARTVAGRWSRVRLDVPPGRGPLRLRVTDASAATSSGAWVVADAVVGTPASDTTTVVLIVSDTHRADHLAAARSDVEVATPALDALAARGVLFEDCWSTTNITKPSHAAVFTGVHPRDSGLISNGESLGADARTLAECFAEAGFATWAAVSIEFLGAGKSGLEQGFDRVLAPGTLWHGGVTVERLLADLPDADGRPLFVWLHLFDAHTPYAPPGEYDRLYYPEERDPFDPDLPPTGIPERCIPAEYADVRDLDYPRAQYRAEVAYLDAALAPLLSHPRLGAGVLAFTSDHGEVFEKQGSYFNHSVLLPDTLHVPLILSWPGAPAGERVSGPVAQIDLGRTLLELADVEAPGFPGRSLLAEGRASGPRFALSSNAWSAAVTHQGWHLVLHLRDHEARFAVPKVAHAVELYDLANDPQCLHDAADEHPEVVRRLRPALVDWLLDARSLGLGRRPAPSAARTARLAALGYVVDDAPTPADAWIDPDCECEHCARLR